MSGQGLPFFLPVGEGRAGQRFGLHHPAAGQAPRGLVVYVHPFAEEMNKARRMAALQSRQLANAGFEVLQIDLHGCGDSSGEFEAASWQDWICDVVQAVAWLRDRHGAPVWLWGLRVGCLLAADAARQLECPVNLLFWQPTTSGRAALQQFLRLRTVGAAMEGASPAARDDARTELAAGRHVAVGGYLLSPALAQGMEQAMLAPVPRLDRAVWLEVSTRPEATLLPATERALQDWRGAGACVDARVVTGPAFWQTVEIEDAPDLLAATLAALRVETVPA
ncbi:MAG: hydrolase 2, exosortase A system-associated [Rubrivivax sp.]|nr:hydrolase 2, exosortase A system-associated [Rubrivivax sp.]